jgi:cyanate lyase
MLPESAASIIRTGRDMAADPMGQARQQAQLIDQAVNNGEIPQLPELPEIDSYLTDVYTKMPEPMKQVVEDIFTGGTSANIEKSLQNNITALTANAENILKDQLDVTYGKFASSGVSGGAMLAAAGDVTTKVMADVTAQVAGFYTNALTQAQQQQQLAFQALDRVIGTAEAQQAMDAQRQAIDMEAQVNLINAKLGMYTELTNQFLAQNQVYSGIIAQEIDRENTEQINSMRMFYEIMVSLATGGPALSNQRSKSSNFSITAPNQKDPVEDGKISDRRLKEDISLIGQSPKGINIYKFRYKDSEGYYQGVMADEVPEARSLRADGYFSVDYSKLDVEFKELN